MRILDQINSFADIYIKVISIILPLLYPLNFLQDFDLSALFKEVL